MYYKSRVQKDCILYKHIIMVILWNSHTWYTLLPQKVTMRVGPVKGCSSTLYEYYKFFVINIKKLFRKFEGIIRFVGPEDQLAMKDFGYM